MLELNVHPHERLELGLLAARCEPGLASPEWLRGLLAADAPAPIEREEAVRGAVRDLLRSKTYKPTGRGKPASEYLVRAAEEGKLGSINAAVDLNNVVSLHSGLPISVVDVERLHPPLEVGLAGEGASYVFNASGQKIQVDGLLCLMDAEGPCANAVKDAQRTKTDAQSGELLYLLWGTREISGRTRAALDWLVELAERVGLTAVEADLRVMD